MVRRRASVGVSDPWTGLWSSMLSFSSSSVLLEQARQSLRNALILGFSQRRVTSSCLCSSQPDSTTPAPACYINRSSTQGGHIFFHAFQIVIAMGIAHFDTLAWPKGYWQFPRRRESIRSCNQNASAGQRPWIPAFAGLTERRGVDFVKTRLHRLHRFTPVI